jgi:hypothetical protein
MVQEIPAEWLLVPCETNRPAGAIGRDWWPNAVGTISREDVCAKCARHLTEASEISSSRLLLRAPDKSFSHTLDSLGRWPQPAYSFRSAQTATLLQFLVPLRNCFVRRWFCVVLGPKPPLYRHNWVSFSKFWDAEPFLIPCPPNVSSRLPLAMKTASKPWHTWRGSIYIDKVLSAISLLFVALPSSEVPEELMNYPI